jgi:hypothetical protein
MIASPHANYPKHTLSSYSLLPLLENEEEKILCTNELGEKSCMGKKFIDIFYL